MSTTTNPVIFAASYQPTPIIALSVVKKVNRGVTISITLNGYADYVMVGAWPIPMTTVARSLTIIS
jgi:hypothetical protein